MYLPRGEWIDFWTREPIHGGRSVVALSPRERIPVWVRSGSIVLTHPARTRRLRPRRHAGGPTPPRGDASGAGPCWDMQRRGRPTAPRCAGSAASGRAQRRAESFGTPSTASRPASDLLRAQPSGLPSSKTQSSNRSSIVGVGDGRALLHQRDEVVRLDRERLGRAGPRYRRPRRSPRRRSARAAPAERPRRGHRRRCGTSPRARARCRGAGSSCRTSHPPGRRSRASREGSAGRGDSDQSQFA